jgi:hypothetical protein
LLQAEALQTAEKSTDRLRQALTRFGVTEVRAQVQAGEAGRADENVARLRQRGVRSTELQLLEEAVRGWMKARELADGGDFSQAQESIQRVARLLGPNSVLAEFRSTLERRQRDFADLLVRLHEATDGERWREVIEVAEQVLAAAPNHAEARKLRARAWKAVEPVTVSMASAQPVVTAEDPPAEGLPTRFLLWIDGIGGYLVCLGGRLTFGQAGLDAHVDVPLVADVSRLHASLIRDSEGYLLEAIRPIQVNGELTSRALLRPGDRVTLGTSCQFLFRLPVPVSGSARLDLVSGHRLPVGVDAVLLMADTLILASGAQAHVTIPDLRQPVVLFRSKDGLGVRHTGNLVINGRKSPERGMLGPQATVVADEVSFGIETVGPRLGPV